MTNTTAGLPIDQDPNVFPVGVPLAWVTGCILLPNGVPVLHTASNHGAVGVTDVRVDPDNTGAIEIIHAAGTATAMLLSPGRTLARHGLVPGGSGGSGRTLIYLHDTHQPIRVSVGNGLYTDAYYTLDLRKSADRARFSGPPGGSLWFAIGLVELAS